MNSEHWILEGTILRPTMVKVQSLLGFIQENISNDEKITIRPPQNPNSPELKTSFLAHKSVLCAASAPLKTMLTAPFSESRSKVIDLDDEDAEFADALVKHLYCQPLNMESYNCGLAKFAHKWELTAIYEAFFLALYVRPMGAIQMFELCLPIMTTLKIPNQLKYLFSKAFGQSLALFEGKFGKQLIWGASRDEDTSMTVPKDDEDSSREETNHYIPESTTSNWYLWDMFWFQGMLVDVFKHVSMYSEIEANGLLLSVLMKFEKDLSDSELDACLCYTGCHLLINKLTPGELIAAKYPRLTYAALKMFCDPLHMTYHPLKVTRKFPLSVLRNDGQAQFEESRYHSNETFIFHLIFRWRKTHGHDSGVVNVRISGDNCLSKSSHSQRYETSGETHPYLGVRASFSACTCVDHSEIRDYIGTFKGIDNCNDRYYRSTSGRTIRFQIMPPSELEASMHTHQTDSCGLVFHLSFYPDVLKQKTWKR